MKIRQFEEGDLQKIDLQEEQKHEIGGVVYPPKTSFTLEYEGKVLGCFAFVEVCEKRGALCSFISKDAGKIMLKMIRRFRKIIEDGMNKTGVERLEMTVLASFEHGERFANLLGFECEGVMRKYYKGRDYKLFARVK